MGGKQVRLSRRLINFYSNNVDGSPGWKELPEGGGLDTGRFFWQQIGIFDLEAVNP
jgi:hypothetical protein